MIHKVKARIKRNPRQSATKIAKEMHISDRSIRRIMKNHLHVKPYRIQKVHALNPTQMKVRLEKAKELKRLHTSGEIPNIVLFDEKIWEGPVSARCDSPLPLTATRA